MKVYAFDRDDTISTSDGPIPLEVVKELDEKYLVYATGNQKLCFEADIIGIGVEEGTKPERLEKVKSLHPDGDNYIVVDDEDLSDVDGWNYYTPEEFVKEELQE